VEKVAVTKALTSKNKIMLIYIQVRLLPPTRVYNNTTHRDDAIRTGNNIYGISRGGFIILAGGDIWPAVYAPVSCATIGKPLYRATTIGATVVIRSNGKKRLHSGHWTVWQGGVVLSGAKVCMYRMPVININFGYPTVT
jgi:hypothetical protein